MLRDLLESPALLGLAVEVLNDIVAETNPAAAHASARDALAARLAEEYARG